MTAKEALAQNMVAQFLLGTAGKESFTSAGLRIKELEAVYKNLFTPPALKKNLLDAVKAMFNASNIKEKDMALTLMCDLKLDRLYTLLLDDLQSGKYESYPAEATKKKFLECLKTLKVKKVIPLLEKKAAMYMASGNTTLYSKTKEVLEALHHS